MKQIIIYFENAQILLIKTYYNVCWDYKSPFFLFFMKKLK